MLLSVDDAFYNMLTAATSTHLKYITFLKHFRSVGEVKVCHILVGKIVVLDEDAMVIVRLGQFELSPEQREHEHSLWCVVYGHGN